MTRADLIAEKADLKQVLVEFDRRFKAAHGKAPSRADKVVSFPNGFSFGVVVVAPLAP